MIAVLQGNTHTLYTHTHTHTLAHKRTHTLHTHTYTHKAKSLAAAYRSHRPSEKLGCLGKSTWERASTLQVGLYHAHGDGMGTRSRTWTTPISGHGQHFDSCFPGNNQFVELYKVFNNHTFCIAVVQYQ